MTLCIQHRMSFQTMNMYKFAIYDQTNKLLDFIKTFNTTYEICCTSIVTRSSSRRHLMQRNALYRGLHFPPTIGRSTAFPCIASCTLIPRTRYILRKVVHSTEKNNTSESNRNSQNRVSVNAY